MLRITLKSPLKSRLISALRHHKPSFSTANLAVDHPEPPPPTTTTTRAAVSRIFNFFLQNHCTKGSGKILRGDPCFKISILELNSSEIEDIVEKLSFENSESALEFFFLLRNDYGFNHSRASHIAVAHVLAKKQRFRALKIHLQHLVQQEGILFICYLSKNSIFLFLPSTRITCPLSPKIL